MVLYQKIQIKDIMLPKLKSKKQNLLSLVKDYKVGAATSSSNFLIRKVLKEVENDCEIIIEQGPGDGVLTQHLLKKLSKSGKIYLIERNEDFIDILKKMKEKDSRIEIFQGNAEDFPYKKILADKKADYIFSSIPFTYIDEKDRQKICQDANFFLKTNGKFIIFHQYSLLMKKMIEKNFGKAKFEFEPLNFLPCFIIIGKK